MQTSRLFLSVATAALASLFLLNNAQGAPPPAEGEYLVYIGTYTREDSKGIYAYRFNTETGEVNWIGLVAELTSPSFLAIHPNRRYLYAVTEIHGEGGAISAYEIDRQSGKLKILNRVSSRGAGPCHLNVDETGRMLVVANYGGGSVASFPVKPDGSLGEASSFIQHEGSSVDPRRQKGPHAHSVNFSPDNRYVVAADLGLDKLMIYRADPAQASLELNNPAFARVKPGGGPRHFTFHPSGRFAYAINEMGSTVTVFHCDQQEGSFDEWQTISTLPEDFSGVNHTAEVLVHPSGKFLYGSNRGHDSIAVFAIDSDKGTLTLVEHASTRGKTPRNFNMDPTGSYLFAANQNTDNVVLFRIDSQTGRLTPTGKTIEIDAPVCIKFVAAE